MTEKDRSIAPLLKGYILLDEIESGQNKDKISELIQMCEQNDEEFIKNINLISFNHIDFKNFKNQTNFFTSYFNDFLQNKNFVEIFGEILKDGKEDNSLDEIFNELNNLFNLDIEQQIKIILGFIKSGMEKYLEDANNLFLEKCQYIHEKKLFAQLTSNKTIENILNLLFDLFKIKNKHDNNEINEEKIKLYIQSFSHYNEQLKSNLQTNEKNKENLEKNGTKFEGCKNSEQKKQIILTKLIFELGPFFVNQDINISEISYIDSNLDLNLISELIIFLLNNYEIKYNKSLKYINKIFLEALNIDNKYIDKLCSIKENQPIKFNIDNIFSLIEKSLNKIDKEKLILSLDNTSFIINSKEKFLIFEEILKKFQFFTNIQNFYTQFLFINWKNVLNQLQLLELMISNKEISESSSISLKNYQGHKVSKDIEIKAYTSSKNQYLIENWRNIKLIETLLLISEKGCYEKVKQIFDWALKNIPEIIIIALTNTKIDYEKNLLMKDIIIEILTSIIKDKTSRINLIEEIWRQNSNIVIFALYNIWKNNTDLMNLNSIFDFCNTILKDSLLYLVNCKYHIFSITLALLAVKRDNLNMEHWLKMSIETYGDEFINSLLEYLNNNIIQPCNNYMNYDQKSRILEKAQLSLESLSILLNKLNSFSNSNINNKLSISIKKSIDIMLKKILDIYDEIQDNQLNSEEIGNEASKILSSMLDGKISVDKVLSMLTEYKLSKDKKANEIFSCLIYGVLDEYRYYNKYPNNKLKLIAELFGKIINNKLLEGLLETLALNYIIEGINSKNESMKFFGFHALSQFIGNISLWPEYVNKLLNMEEIKKNQTIYAQICKEYEKINKISKNFDKIDEDSDKFIPFLPLNFVRGSESDLKSSDELKINFNESDKSIKLDINTCKDTKIKDNKIEKPKNEIIAKVKNIFNILNESCIEEKSLELILIFQNDDKIIRWFSYFFITTKINYMKNIPFSLYNTLFIRINNPLLFKYNLKDTIKYIQELLSLDYLYIDEKFKSILKNLGTWLGINTILKNKPILAIDIDFRELISNSYRNGNLITVVPFICRIFSYINNSQIFKPNNPWINSILSILSEVYCKQGISQFIKNEIESFFDFIKVDMKTFKNNSKYLNTIVRLKSKNYDFPPENEKQINCDIKDISKKIRYLNDYINNVLNLIKDEDKIEYGTYYINDSLNSEENEIRKNNDNETLNNNNLDSQKELISVLANIMQISIQDSNTDLIDIYINKPILSAMAIVNQDLMFEKDVNKYEMALNNMIQYFLKSFCMFVYYEKLKLNIELNLDKYYKSKHLDKDAISKIKEIPNSEYIIIGFEYIQKVIIAETQAKINSNKEIHKERDKRKTNNPFFFQNSQMFQNYSKIMHKIPKELRPNEQGLKENELKIYQKFNINDFKSDEKEKHKGSFLNTVYRILKEVIDKYKNDNSPNKINTYKNYDFCMQNIQNICKKNNLNFERTNELDCLKRIITDSKIDKNDGIIFKLAFNTFHYILSSILFKNRLLFITYMPILRGWLKLQNEISNKITIELFEGNIDIFIKFNHELHLTLYKQKIIDTTLYENYFKDLLLNSSIKNTFLIGLLKHLIENNITHNSSMLFHKKSSYLYDSDIFFSLFNQKSSWLYISNYKFYLIDKKSDSNEFDKSFINNFICIVQEMKKKYFITTANNNKEFDNKEREIIPLNICLKNIQHMVDFCMEKYYNIKCVDYIYFLSPENLCLFIYYILIKSESNDVINTFNDILDIIINHFHKKYIDLKKFHQIKYYKLFIYLIYFISNKFNTDNNNKIKTNLLLSISDTLNTLSPQNYPGFTAAWLDLISYNYFINNILEENLIKEKNEIYEKYLVLLEDLISYINSLKDVIVKNYYYKYILDQIYKFFFLLTKSYSSFMSSYCYILISFLSLFTQNGSKKNKVFIQLKNIILSAIPKNIIYKDKTIEEISKNNYKENFMNIKLYKDHLVPENILYLLFNNNYEKVKFIKKENYHLSNLFDKYLNDENNMAQILNYLESITDEKELYWTYNGLMIFWTQKKQKQITENKIKGKKLFYNLYKYLLCNLSEVHQIYLIDSILNALRFPCSQTYCISLLFQELYINLDNEEIEKKLFINICERMLYWPIPWGIKYTLNCLNNNNKYQKMVAKMMNNEMRPFLKNVETSKEKNNKNKNNV